MAKVIRKKAKGVKARKTVKRNTAAPKKKKAPVKHAKIAAPVVAAPEIVPDLRAVNPDAVTDPAHAPGHRRLNLYKNIPVHPSR